MQPGVPHDSQARSVLRAQLAASAALLPFDIDIDGDGLRFVALTEEQYLRASFLDARVVRPGMRTGSVPWAFIDEWRADYRPCCDFVFHVSHCGSTLVSRLLGFHPAIFAVREPGSLRAAAATRLDRNRIGRLTGLLSRTFHPGQRALVKTTSVVSRIAEPLLEIVPDARAILMTVAPETFLAAVLDGSPGDIRTHAADRWDRLEAQGLVSGCQRDSLGTGELAAAAWLAEMASLGMLAGRFPSRTQWVDFERFLEAPSRQLTALLAFLGLSGDVAAALSGPLMRHYAKRPDVRYDAETRRVLLDRARVRFAAEIQSGLDWLADITSRVPRLTGMLETPIHQCDAETSPPFLDPNAE